MPTVVWQGFLLVILACLAQAACAQANSFTFEDGLDPRTQPRAAEWTQRLLSALESNRAQAMFFPAGKIIDSPQGFQQVRAWADAGHDIGNHTYSHRNFGSTRMSIEVFTEDVLRAEQLLSSTPRWQRRLRFPYLKEGETAEKRDGMRAWMDRHGYQPAPVSIDSSDWYYDQRYAERGPRSEASVARFRRLYLHHLFQRAQYYDELARQVLGRSPPHVMLLHANRINAEFIGDAIQMFRSKGWKVVAPAEAFRDPLYSVRVQVLPAGESILWALAKQSGMPDLRYPAEDGVYEKPILDAADD